AVNEHAARRDVERRVGRGVVLDAIGQRDRLALELERVQVETLREENSLADEQQVAVNVSDPGRRGHDKTRRAAVDRPEVNSVTVRVLAANDKQESPSVREKNRPGMLELAKRGVHLRQA